MTEEIIDAEVISTKVEETEDERVERLLRSAKVLIATPCYGGMCTADYMRSMTGIAALSARFGINISIITTTNESLVHKARNSLASQFMNGDFTHLMFIDADVSFNPDDVLKLILRDKDMVAGLYPLKQIAWDHLLSYKTESADELKRAGLTYTYGKKDENGKYLDKGSLSLTGNDEGLVEADAVGTGFLMIKRAVFEKMFTNDEDNWYVDPNIGPVHQYFYTSVNKDTRDFIGEDWTFCQVWRDLGGKIYVDPSIHLVHTGSYAFEGRLLSTKDSNLN
jgi:hypothetical protein